MGREEARAKGWEIFRENMVRQIKEDGGSEQAWELIEDSMRQKIYDSFDSWRIARAAERNRDFKKARMYYLNAVESLDKTQQLTAIPAAEGIINKLKSEYCDFVVHRDPFYRLLLKHPLDWVKDHPGILQTELYKEFPHHKREDMTYVLYFAEKEGLIRREKKGRSYELFFEREKAADEPFLKLEDDEFDLAEKAEQERIKAEQAEIGKKGCLYALAFLFWVGALVAAGALAGFVGAGIVVVAFIVWQIIRGIRRKKQKPAEAMPPSEATPPSALEDSSDKTNGEGENNSL